MSKAPLGDLSVNTFERHRNANLLLSPLRTIKNENCMSARSSPYRSSPHRLTKQQQCQLLSNQTTVGVLTDVTISVVQVHDKQTMTSDYADDDVKYRTNMNEDLFNMCVKADAPESYWKIIAEKRRLAIEETQNENEQLHELIEQLNEENEHLRDLAEQCQYLNNIVLELVPQDEQKDAEMKINGNEYLTSTTHQEQ